MKKFIEDVVALAIRRTEELKRRTPQFPPEVLKARIHAGHWINWPLFVSQPVIPIFLCYFPNPILATLFIFAMVVLNIAWIRWVAPLGVLAPLANVGELFAKLKWLSSPLAFIFLLRGGHPYLAVFALTWPALLIQLLLLLRLYRAWPPNILQETMERLRLADNRRDH